ncbi:EamA family transporter [Allorhizobium sp. BGMRC 0089]|uniref:EamA family transporter n=1 Tax=Allorhizobium sonneratiae TaxID=2934936 RepID=UPI0020336A07|nr:EamA family transporter [Allorhizobium sonneratiae]MCM2292973.1 EamA family transporter [Allorhizobium sonneratiae]
MRSQHILLALLVAVIWGVNFTVISVGLGSFPPLMLAVLRFVIAALPAFFLPRPPIAWPLFIAIGVFLFLGQFAFLFTGMAAGMPAGLASVVLQMQAFLTIPVAAMTLGEKPTLRQAGGSLLAFAGLGVIAVSAGAGDFTLAGLGLCLAAALCWAIGNVLLRQAGKADILPLIVWLSLIPPLPLLALSFMMDGPAMSLHALSSISFSGAGAVLYIAVLSTLAGYAIWGHLLKHYPTAMVAPFSLLVPVFGAGSAALFLGETFDPAKLFGMMLILAGLFVAVFPVKRLFSPARS